MASLEDLPVEDSSGPKELFETVNMLDERLCVKDSLLYAVEKSGAQISHHRQAASSATTSGLSFSGLAGGNRAKVLNYYFNKSTLCI